MNKPEKLQSRKTTPNVIRFSFRGVDYTVASTSIKKLQDALRLIPFAEETYGEVAQVLQEIGAQKVEL